MTVILEGSKPLSVRKFGQLNTATEETKLPDGDSPNASNVWTDESPGSLQTAKGFDLAGTITGGGPVRFLFNFRKDDGTQFVLVSDGATVWWTRDFKTFTSLITGLSSSFQLRATTVRGKVWFTNGNDSIRTWDGTTLTVLDGSGGTPNVPKGKFITYYHERVRMFNISGSRSSERFSALVDSAGTEIAPDTANAWPATNEIKIGDGDGEFGTGVRIYRGKLHYFKTTSIWRLEGIDEFSYFPIKTSAEVGPRSQESIQELDDLIHFVGLNGVYTFDGDSTERISDAINPSGTLSNLSVSELQQLDSNTQFWLQSTDADFTAGTLPANFDSDTDTLILKPADDLTADFNAGSEKTNILVGTDSFTLSRVATSTPSDTANLCLLQTVNGSADFIVSPVQNVIDGSTATIASLVGQPTDGSSMYIEIVFSATQSINKIVVRNYASRTFSIGSPSALNSTIQYNNGTSWITLGTLTGTVTVSDLTLTFTPVLATKIRILGNTSLTCNLVVGEFEAYAPAYSATGKFASRTLDNLATPTTLGVFQCDYDLNGGTATFFTQSSADGISWDAEVLATPGSAIASTARRYVRWGVSLTSTAAQTASPEIRKAYLGGTFVSQKHDTASTIFQWKAFQADYDNAGGTSAFYYRTATTNLLLDSASWVAILPGSDIISATASTFVQFKIELSAGSATREPLVNDVTINWITGASAAQVRSNQIIHGVSWKGRYWFDASEVGQSANNIVIIRGKKSFGYPWHMKRSWSIIPFLIFNDTLYGGSSVDGKIYRLDFGYSLAGSAMDSFFETGDLVGDDPDLQKVLLQIIVDYEKMGDNADYDLTVGYSTDRGETWTEKTIALTGTGRATKALNVIARSVQFRFRWRSNAIDAPFLVHGLDGIYRPTKFR